MKLYKKAVSLFLVGDSLHFAIPLGGPRSVLKLLKDSLTNQLGTRNFIFIEYWFRLVFGISLQTNPKAAQSFRSISRGAGTLWIPRCTPAEVWAGLLSQTKFLPRELYCAVSATSQSTRYRHNCSQGNPQKYRWKKSSLMKMNILSPHAQQFTSRKHFYLIFNISELKKLVCSMSPCNSQWDD